MGMFMDCGIPSLNFIIINLDLIFMEEFLVH